MVPLLFVVHPHQHGWRWAIYRATRNEFDAEPLSRCVNAGFKTSQAAADDVGQQCLYTLLAFAAGLPVRVEVTPLVLEVDPLPGIALPAVEVSPGILQIGGR